MEIRDPQNPKTPKHLVDLRKGQYQDPSKPQTPDFLNPRPIQEIKKPEKEKLKPNNSIELFSLSLIVLSLTLAWIFLK